MPAASPPHHRRPLLVGLAAVLLVAIVGPTAAVADDVVVPGDTVVGELVQAWSEPEAHEAAEHAADGPLTWIETESGEAVRVSTEDLAASVPADVEAGATVEVVVGAEVADEATVEEGLEPAREVLAAEVIEAAPADVPLGAGTTNQVTVVMMVPAGASAEPGRTWEQVVAAVDGPVAEYWDEQTAGAVQLAVVGAKHDWAQTTASCSDPYGLWNAAATRAGWTPGAGKHLLVYVPRNAPGCSYGLATVGAGMGSGGRLYVQDVETSVLAHEFGHNFGLGHSSARQCDLGTEAGSCRDVEYRDYYDVMGISGQWVGSLSPPHAARLGVLPAGSVTGVSTPAVAAVHTLVPYGAPASTAGTRVLRLTDPAGVVYWLEYRTAAGRDAWLGGGLNAFGLEQGVLLRRSGPTGNTSLLLDGTPSISSGWNGDWRTALPVGVPTEVAGANFRVTVQAVGPAGATVAVETLKGDPACLRRTSVPTSGVAVLDSPDGPVVLGVGNDRALWTRPVDGAPTSWRSLGGGALYGPAAVTAGGTSHVFVVGTNGALFTRAGSGGTWSAWRPLGGYLTSSPAAASLGDGHVRVVGRGGDGHLWTREMVDGEWSAWALLGGFLSGAPAAAADPAGDRVLVSVRGNDGRIYEQQLAEGATTGTFAQRSLATCSGPALAPSQSAADPAQVAFLDSRASPLLLDGAGSVEAIGGGLTSTPAVLSTGGSFLVAGRGGDNALWVYDARPDGDGWVSLGGALR